MERYYKKNPVSKSSSKLNGSGSNELLSHPKVSGEAIDTLNPKRRCLELNPTSLIEDPGLRIPILDYHPNVRDEVRRRYWQNGPCQPRGHNFRQTLQGKVFRRFNPLWFDDGNSAWLEYSIAKEAAYCLCCYLFKSDSKEHAGSCDAFVVEGFSNWRRKEKIQTHVGGPNSSHNQALKNCEALLKQVQHIQTVFNKQSDQSRHDNRIRLNASIDCTRFLLRQGLAFRGHDESSDSNNQGNFLETLKLLVDHNKDIKRVYDNSPGNLKLVSPDIQKDIVNACAVETTNVIIKDLGNALFSILVDEARDISTKEQMAVVIRYVNKCGNVIESLLGIVHVIDTTSLSLKMAIEELFSRHKLSMSRLRGQGYDGASNMQGEFKGLKALILKENEYAFYVHCFAHRLQLALVAVAKNDMRIAFLFTLVTNAVNVVGASCKRHDILQDIQAMKVMKALESGELSSGKGLNQETSLKRAGDTRWGSHYNTLVSLISMFSSVIDVLEFVVKDCPKSEQRVEAYSLMDSLQTYDFAFTLHLMRNIMGVTNELSQALQRKDQDIVNAMTLVKISKQRLQLMRDEGWDSLLNEVSTFCGKHEIDVPNMDDIFVVRGRARRNVEKMTNMHHYRVEVLYSVIDMQLQELNHRFNEVNTELLLCVACLNPSDSFASFDKQKLIRLAQFYPIEFSAVQLITLDNQLETYITDMRSSNQFLELNGIASLAKKMVEMKKDLSYHLVYKLITLALILPVATASVERAFSAMKIVKNRLRNRMGDQWMADSLITYVEKDIFKSITNEVIMERFQNMKNRRGQI